MLATLVALLSSCSNAQEPQSEPMSAKAAAAPGAKKILIVYLSRTSNTKTVAEFIHQKVGGEMVALELQKPYPANYQATVKQVERENESGYLPPLKTKIERVEQYDTVFVGFPTWGMQLPPPMKSFLRQTDLRGKTVIPFNTNAGYGEGSSFQTVRELCPQSTIPEGFVTKGGIERDGKLLVIKDARAQQVRKEVENWLVRRSNRSRIVS